MKQQRSATLLAMTVLTVAAIVGWSTPASAASFSDLQVSGDTNIYGQLWQNNILHVLGMGISGNVINFSGGGSASGNTPTLNFNQGNSQFYDNGQLHVKTDDFLYLDAPTTTFVQSGLNVGGSATVSGSLTAGALTVSSCTGCGGSTVTYTGLSSLNGLTGTSQTFAVGSSGTDFAVASSGTSHTFNLPDASSTARGLLNTGTQTISGTKTFTGTMTLTGANNFLVQPGQGIDVASAGFLTIGGATATTVDIAPTASATTILIGKGTAGNTVSIANGLNTVAQVVNIAAGAAGANNTVNIANGVNTAGVTAVSIGSNTNLANTTTIMGGNSTAAIALTPQTTGTIVIGAAAGTGAITLGSSSGTQTVNVATGAGAPTVNVATGTGGTVKIGAAGTVNGQGVRLGASRMITANKPTSPIDCAAGNLTPSVTQVLEASIFTCATTQNVTLPTAQGSSGLIQALPGAVVGDTYNIVLAENHATNTLTFVAGTGTTIYGIATITNGARVWTCRVTSVVANSETQTCY